SRVVARLLEELFSNYIPSEGEVSKFDTISVAALTNPLWKDQVKDLINNTGIEPAELCQKPPHNLTTMLDPSKASKVEFIKNAWGFSDIELIDLDFKVLSALTNNNQELNAVKSLKDHGVTKQNLQQANGENIGLITNYKYASHADSLLERHGKGIILGLCDNALSPGELHEELAAANNRSNETRANLTQIEPIEFLPGKSPDDRASPTSVADPFSGSLKPLPVRPLPGGDGCSPQR
ncbi:MAG: hypothetical protein AAF153_00995, partial [Pseudomonadota bacterium]